MNAWTFPVTRLPGSAPQGPVIEARDLARYFEAADVLEHARRQAALREEKTRDMLAQATAEASHIKEEAYAQGTRDAWREIESARRQAIASAVHWLVEENTLEQQIAERLEKRIRDLATQALTEFIGEQNLNEIFARRLQQKITDGIGNGNLVVRVHPDQLPSIREVFASDARLSVIADEAVDQSNAMLETPLVTLQFSLYEHLDTLISRLAGKAL